MRIAIVEDEKVQVEQLASFLQRYGEEKGLSFEIATFDNGLSFIENFRTQYDVIFMDIEMAQMDGMEAARRLREKDEDVVLVFITNMTQYAIMGYEVNAFDYIVKPIPYFQFAHKLDRICKRVQSKKSSYIVLSLKGGIKKKLDCNDILYLESDQHYVNVVASDQTYNLRDTLSNLLLQLPEHFFACGKSYVVNLEHVGSVNATDVTLKNGMVIPISRSYKKTFLNGFTKYFSEG